MGLGLMMHAEKIVWNANNACYTFHMNKCVCGLYVSLSSDELQHCNRKQQQR